MTKLEHAERQLSGSSFVGAKGAIHGATKSFWVLAMAVVALLGGLRFVHVSADTPSWVSPSAAPYVDEGYKTLSARNLVVYGKTHWNPVDNYSGWMKASPIPSWSYYVAFRLFSPCLAAARTVSILYFSLFLLVWVILLQNRYALTVMLAGLLLVGLDPGLFFFSRLALLEVPMIFALYGFFFILARYLEALVWFPLLLAIGITPLLALGIKMSALIYLPPVIGALLLRATLLQKHIPFKWRLGVICIMVILCVMVAHATERTYLARLGVDPLNCVRRFLTNPLVTISPFLFLAGWLCGIHLVVCRPSHVLASSFRTALLGLALLGPMAMSLFSYDPPRYSVPFIPAYALIICEWLAAPKGASNEAEMRSPAAAVMIIGIAAGFMFGADIFQHFGLVILRNFTAAASLLQGKMKLGLGFLLSLAVTSALYWALGQKLFDRRKVAIVLGVCSLLLGIYSMFRLGDFLLVPSYQGNLVRAQIVKAIPAGSSVIGDWAPFFALGTGFRPLDMVNEVNPASHLVILHPDYFLYSDTVASQDNLAQIRKLQVVTLGPAILRAEYNHKSVILYPLSFNASVPATKPGG